MGTALLIALTVGLFVLGIGGVAFAFSTSGDASKKRLASVTRQQAFATGGREATNSNAQRRKNVTAMLKELEVKQTARKQRPTLRRRLEQAGLKISPRSFWMLSGTAALITAAVCLLFHQSFLIVALASFGIGLGLPRWILHFLKGRRLKSFTNEFANAIDVIVRSVKSGLPTNEALKIVSKEMAPVVAEEFSKLVEGLKVGVTLEQGLKRMLDSMPTAEVSFFGIVMTI